MPTVPSQSPLPYYRSSILWLFLAPALGGFLFGYDIGGTSFVVLQLASLSSASTSLSLEDAPMKTGWFVSSPSAGALLGTAFLMYIDQSNNSSYNNDNNNKGRGNRASKAWMQRFLAPIGRRTELCYAGVLYALGGLLQYGSSFLSLYPFVVLSLGRWIYGAGIGFAMHGGPTYLAETTPPSVRGMVVGGKEIAIVLGILTGYVAGNALCHENDGGDSSGGGSSSKEWAYVYAATVLGAIAMIGCTSFLPESARYLVSQAGSSPAFCGDDDEDDESVRRLSAEVLESLQFVWKPARAREEHGALMEVFYRTRKAAGGNENEGETPMVPRLCPPDPSVVPALRAGLGLVVLQQITGQPSVLSYATPILARVPGLSASSSVLLAVFKVLATTVSVVLVERNGRKTLLTVGCSLMLAALLVLAFAFAEPQTPNEGPSEAPNDARSVLSLLGMFAYIAGYQIGFGPITWLMISEVFPQSVRGKAVALAVQVNFALNALVQFLVPVLRESLGMSGTFAVFGVLAAYSLCFVRNSVPETKGMTLEEIEESFAEMLAGKDSATKRGTASGATEKDDNGGGGGSDERIRLLSPV